MSNNINISSGSDFSKRIFGPITKPQKPAFVHNGSVFSDNIFKNQKISSILQNNTYYIDHGLPDDYVIYEQILGFFNETEYEGMSSISNDFISFIQSLNNLSPIQQRAIISTANSILSNTTGSNLSSSVGSNSSDPYDNNPPPPCPI